MMMDLYQGNGTVWGVFVYARLHSSWENYFCWDFIKMLLYLQLVLDKETSVIFFRKGKLFNKCCSVTEYPYKKKNLYSLLHITYKTEFRMDQRAKNNFINFFRPIPFTNSHSV